VVMVVMVCFQEYLCGLEWINFSIYSSSVVTVNLVLVSIHLCDNNFSFILLLSFDRIIVLLFM